RRQRQGPDGAHHRGRRRLLRRGAALAVPLGYLRAATRHEGRRPSNPADAKGLMISAIRDDNPVVYMFHKGIMGLPWMAKNPRSVAPVPEEPYETPIGKAAVARAGSDATVVTLSLSVHHALDVAE